MHADPKSAKKVSQVKQLFVLLGSASLKAAHKHVDEIQPELFTEIFRISFDLAHFLNKIISHL